MPSTNYNDKVTLIFNQQAKAIQSLDIVTYLSDPKDAVQIGAQFSQLPDGANHVATMQLKGVSKGEEQVSRPPLQPRPLSQ